MYVFSVDVQSSLSFIGSHQRCYQVVAPNASAAIKKAIRAARRDFAYRGKWHVWRLKLRGPAL